MHHRSQIINVNLGYCRDVYSWVTNRIRVFDKLSKEVKKVVHLRLRRLETLAAQSACSGGVKLAWSL